MSSRNREKRRAKQKARAERNRAYDPGSGGRFDQERAQRELLREAVELLVTAAVNAQHDGDGAALAGHVRGLATAPHGPTGRRIVNRALTAWLDRAIDAAWRHGWQPVDLHRIVSRQAGQRSARLVVDAIAARMRPYAAATVDERWEAQLRALDATVWWENDDSWLDAWGEREGRERAEAVLDVVELLSLLHSLPAIQPLCPQPGTARRGAPNTGRSTDPRILDKVRALLAKAESTGFAEEAEALTAKAQELMTRHSIDEALLAAREGLRDEPTGWRIGIDNPYEAAKAMLLHVAADTNRCRSVWTRKLGFATVVGYAPDLDAVELLYTSLLVQATTAMTQAGSRQDRHGRSRTRSFRQSFLTSFATRIGERLKAATEQAGSEAAAASGDDRLLPVLAARDDAVRMATETMFPEIVAKAVSATDGEGWAVGRAAADLASLRVREAVTDARTG